MIRALQAISKHPSTVAGLLSSRMSPKTHAQQLEEIIALCQEGDNYNENPLPLDKIKEFTDKEIHLENQVNPELIGGFVLRIGDIQYDASIARKLDRMKREFTNSL